MKHTRRFLLAGLSILAMSLTVTSVLAGEKNYQVVVGYTNGDAATYYSGVESSTDANLLTNLQALNTTKRQSLVGYDSMPNKFQLTDPGTSSGQVTSFYSGTSARYSGNMNREHVWPASKTIGGRGNDPLEDDIHMTRPTLESENTSRGNSFFTVASGQGWDPASLGNESYRGDSARIIFYCVVADSRLSLVDRDYDASTNHTMGKLSTLLQWNLQYPVNQREKVRNEEAEKLQGNRNPFIDHPEYACRIWGNYNSATKAACAAQPVDPDLEGLELSIHEKHIEIGETFNIAVSVKPTELTNKVDLVWYSEDESVASYNNGTVKGLKNGTTKIVVSTSDCLFIDECEVVVGTGKSDEKPAQKSGCSGSVVTSSIILSALSLIGLDLVLFKKISKKKENS